MEEKGLLIVCVVIGVMLLILAVINVAGWLQSFRAELCYLNKEIERTSGKEKEMWKMRKKRLLLSLIPFVRY